MKDAVIVSAVRTAAGKAPKGTLSVMRPDDMASVVIREALSRAPGASPQDVEDVILGCAMPEGEQGFNVARIASLRAGVPIEASAVTVNRFCSSGLQAIAYGAERIMLGHAQVAIAGGTESMSMVPMSGNKLSPNPSLVDTLSRRLSQHGARGRKPRAAVRHLARGAGRVRAAQSSARGRGDRSRPLQGRDRAADGDARRPERQRRRMAAAEPSGCTRASRSSTSTRGRAATRRRRRSPSCGRRSTPRARSPPATRRRRATAPPRSLITSADYAKAHGLKPLARFVAYATAGVAPELFGIGPVPAIRRRS